MEKITQYDSQFMTMYKNFNAQNKNKNKNIFEILGHKLGKQLHTDLCNGLCDRDETRRKILDTISSEISDDINILNNDLCDFIVNTTDYIRKNRNKPIDINTSQYKFAL